MKTRSLKICLSLLLVWNLNTSIIAQTQIGTDIEGNAWGVPGDYFGSSVCMPDVNTVAIGAIAYDALSLDTSYVRVYSWVSGVWVQKGSDINEEMWGDVSGCAISMPDANTIAIGAYRNNGNGTQSGHVRIYVWDGSDWVQKGLDLDGEVADDWSGYSVSMPDANTVAIGAPRNSDSGFDAGHARVFSWDGVSWIQKGIDIDGEAAHDFSGSSVSMPDSNTLAVGAPGNGNFGSVRVYMWDGSIWAQKGVDLDGEVVWGGYSGGSVCMPDANTVAIGDYYNAGNGFNSGHVRVYIWDGNSWVQKGIDIDGEAANDQSGFSISMPNSNMIAIGAYGNDGNGDNAGHVRVYSWDGNAWVQFGIDIDGEAQYDGSGLVSMPDAQTIAIGAPNNDGNGLDAGHVRVYSLLSINIIENDFENSLVVFPNPNNGNLSLNLGSSFENAHVDVKNVLGQVIDQYTFNNSSNIQFTLNGPTGIFFVEVKAGQKKALVKVFKE